METVTPYQTLDEALNALDNGRRFYNIFTKAHDGVISKAELGKVGKVFGDKRQMILFLELSTYTLSVEAKNTLISKLDEDLKKAYAKYKPIIMDFSERTPDTASSIILKGTPKLIKSHSNFNGMIMIPIMAGNVTTFTMVPMIDEYDLYELQDSTSDSQLLMAHVKGKKQLPEKEVIVGGILKEVQNQSKETEEDKVFLEVSYLLDIA